MSILSTRTEYSKIDSLKCMQSNLFLPRISAYDPKQLFEHRSLKFKCKNGQHWNYRLCNSNSCYLWQYLLSSSNYTQTKTKTVVSIWSISRAISIISFGIIP